MEISSFRGLAELGMDDNLFFHHWYTNNNSLENIIPSSMAPLMHEDYFQQQQPMLDFKRPAPESCVEGSIRPSKQLKHTTTCDSNFTINPTIQTVKPKEETIWSSYYNTVNSSSVPGKNNCILKPTTTKDHILSERKRREKISQRLIALSALVPGLKKMDKASVLGDAVKHLKQLQDKIKILEEQTKTKSMEKLVLVRKYETHADGDETFSNVTESLPEIQARFCNKDVLIIINCEKRKGLLEKVAAEVEKLNLSVANSSVMAFGDYALNITLLAKKDDEFAMSMNELVNILRSALKIFM
ncbi:hypothetical protein CASFOL_019893 [Castilleja foliolosa]|uniref:BHLH domain-containing protein n=1 Tax=Castilleja foliolosa TaxID=1961234 RepID=A0ABD3CZA7_9LAMI